MNQTGLSFEQLKIPNIYDACITKESLQQSISRLTNQLWKLIPMREKEEDWRRQLESVTIEISGLNCIFNSLLLQLLSKLHGLAVEDCSFEVYRKTVFECISLLQEFGKND